MIKMATAKRDPSPTDKITFTVCFPINAIKPSSVRASIRTNKAAKNSRVDHST